jgi:N-acetylglucosamine malate deacetylase 1
MNSVLVVAPHPDDETLGCGGTLLKYINNNDKVYWLIITKADNSNSAINDIVDVQKQYIELVNNKYRFEDIFHLDYLTTKLDRYPLDQLINSLSEIIKEVRPTTILIPNRCDVHSDHRIVFDAIYSCTKNFRYPYIKKILMYETLSETEFAPCVSDRIFLPNYFVDITVEFCTKIEIMKLFSTEQMEEPYPRSLSSIEALARYRGSRIGVRYAEAFQLLLEIE